MAWICLSMILYRVILTIILVVEVVKLNEEISKYHDCCASKDGGCARSYDKKDLSSEAENSRECIDDLDVRVDTIEGAKFMRNLCVYAAVVVGLYIIVSLLGFQQGYTGGRAEREKENEVVAPVVSPVVAGSRNICNMEAQVVPGIFVGRVVDGVGSTAVTGEVVGRVEQGQVQQMQPQGEFEMSVPNATPVKY